ncbi:MAG: glycosyltransferase [Candidatus Symbiothrix sp.]|jgi:glycosyltransferase involved in cell wall biosynthesis|nr:glycosyltransferase [Candidatus Symbiothrix sp.]
MKLMQVITQSELGGAQSVALQLANYFVAQEGNTVYMVSGGPGDAWKELDPRVQVIYIKESRKKIGLQDIIVFLKLWLIRLKYKPDVVHLHSSKAGALGRLAFPCKRIIYTVHGFDSIRLAFRAFLPIEKLLKKCAKYIVGVSRYDVENLEKEGVKGSVCVYNGISDKSLGDNNTDDIQTEISRLQALKNEGKFIVATIARLGKQKKFDLFCEIAERYPNPNIAFVWIGNQTQPENTPPNVYCLGEVKAAHRLLSCIDLFILTSNYEGLPISIIEALSYGKPVVASDVGGTCEILDGNNGYALPNRAEAFIEKIERYRNESEVYEEACRAARSTYLQYFTVEKMCVEYGGLYG